jgi:hypothetical protein
MRSLVNGGQREKTSADSLNYSSRLMKLTALFRIAVNYLPATPEATKEMKKNLLIGSFDH